MPEKYINEIGALGGAKTFIGMCFDAQSYGIDKLTELLKLGDTDWALISSIYTLFLPFAYALVAVFFVIDIVEKATSQHGFKDLDEKFVITCLLRLFLASALLNFGENFLNQMCSLFNAFCDMAKGLEAGATTPEEVDEKYEALVAILDDWGYIKDAITIMAAMVVGLINTLLNSIMNVILLFHIFSKKIEIIILFGFSGIAFASCFSEGGKTHASTYIKKMMACALHAASILLIIKICSTLESSSAFEVATATDGSTDWTAYWNKRLTDIGGIVTGGIYKFAAVGSISMAKSIINDAFGS